MSYNASIPLNSDSPSIFPAQSQTNYTRLQTLIGADHQFNLSAAANDGYHNVVHLTQQAPSGVLAGTGRFYGKSSASRINAFYMDDQGAEYQLTPTMPIRAAVNFNGTGGNGPQAIRTQFNVGSVVKTGTGSYTVNFTNAMLSDGYIVTVTGMRTSSGDEAIACVAGNGSYGSSVTAGSVKIQFFGTSGSLRDVVMGNVMVMSVI